MDSGIRSRINAMFLRDCSMAAGSVLLLWVTIAFVYVAVDQFIANRAIQLVLLVGAALVLVFNTASVIAMIRHYAEDKQHIYGLDIRHLDENRLRATLQQAEQVVVRETSVRI